MHFLNCAVKTKDKIVDVELLNSEIIPENVLEKGSRLDILAKTQSGDLIDIEMQVNRDHHMIGRSLYYWSKLFAGQLEIGEGYSKLRRTITINILNFVLFHNDDRFWRKCLIADKDTKDQITDLLEIQFVELNKMKKLDANSPITFWIEFFKDPYSDTCKELYKKVPELKKAKEMMERAKADPKTRQLIEERENAARNYASAIADAKFEGMEEGKEEGEKIGLEKGEKIGIEKGKAEEREKANKELAEERAKAYTEKIALAKKMLYDGMSIELVAKYSGLTIDELQRC